MKYFFWHIASREVRRFGGLAAIAKILVDFIKSHGVLYTSTKVREQLYIQRNQKLYPVEKPKYLTAKQKSTLESDLRDVQAIEPKILINPMRLERPVYVAQLDAVGIILKGLCNYLSKQNISPVHIYIGKHLPVDWNQASRTDMFISLEEQNFVAINAISLPSFFPAAGKESIFRTMFLVVMFETVQTITVISNKQSRNFHLRFGQVIRELRPSLKYEFQD